MDGSAAISPELVLVCPELREQAIALLPDVGWQSFVARARAQSYAHAAAPVAAPRLEPLTTAALLALARWMVISFVGVTLLTLAMTLVANAVR